MQKVVRALAGIGLTADAVTLASLVLGAAAAMFVASGNFSLAAVTIAVASLGDALDGALARATKTASARGAIFDATVDRYEEFFYLAGLGFFFRTNACCLGLVMAAIAGSFMVSYGSAKAEAMHVPVPPSSMRRTGRAIVLTLGTALVPVARALAERGLLPETATLAPILAALLVVALVANVSAVRRLRLVGRSVTPATGDE